MKSMDCITKRLLAVEQNHKRPLTFVCSYPSRADGTAYFLSGGMEKEESVVSGKLKIKLHWGGRPPASDSFKLKWLDQYAQAQIDEIRREWEESTFERGKIALVELDRLLSLMEGSS